MNEKLFNEICQHLQAVEGKPDPKFCFPIDEIKCEDMIPLLMARLSAVEAERDAFAARLTAVEAQRDSLLAACKEAFSLMGGLYATRRRKEIYNQLQAAISNAKGTQP